MYLDSSSGVGGDCFVLYCIVFVLSASLYICVWEVQPLDSTEVGWGKAEVISLFSWAICFECSSE